jgi:hypothetical protein
MAGVVHDWLCVRAYHWLLTSGECRWALRETGESKHGERPDALGWLRNRKSLLIECKATRADFHIDKKKVFRDPDYWDHGLGQRRYYMSTPGVITPEMLPPGWGLLICHRLKVDVAVEPLKIAFNERVLLNEIKLLFRLFGDLPSVPFRHNYEHEDRLHHINIPVENILPWEYKGKEKKAPPVFR